MLKDGSTFTFIFVCVCTYGYVYMYIYPLRSKDAVGIPGAGITGGCEMPYVGMGTITWII